MVRAQRECLVKTCQRLFVTFHIVQDQPVIRQCADRIGLALQRRGNQGKRFGVAALLAAQHAKQMLRIEQARHFLQRALIERFGFGQLATLMQFERPCQRLPRGERSVLRRQRIAYGLRSWRRPLAQANCPVDVL